MAKLHYVFLGIIVPTTISYGKILHVPQEYSTIQSAINAASTSDTVLVATGTYYENIRFHGKGIVVSSNYYLTHDWATVAATIINGSTATNKDTASTVQFLDKEDSTAVIDGFTITGGSGTRYLFPNGTGTTKYQEGAGIILHYSSAIIRNNIIINNTTVPQSGVSNGGGGGIATMYGNPAIYNNVVASNTSGYAGGLVLNWSSGKVYNNIFFHNTGGTGFGTGGVMIWDAPANTGIVENNTIIDNVSLKSNYAGGIHIDIGTGGAPIVRNNIVWGNRQPSGSQINLTQYCTYNDVEDYSGSTNISSFPLLQPQSFLLADSSPCIDAGDTAAVCKDIENTSNIGYALVPSKGTLRNDIGAFGGALAKILPSITVYDMRLSKSSIALSCSTGQTVNTAVEILNRSSVAVTMDSITTKNSTVFHASNKLDSRLLTIVKNDSIIISCTPTQSGTFKDTVYIYHNASGVQNPLTIPITLTVTASTGVETGSVTPQEFRLYQNSPNPFNPSTTIRYSLAAKSMVSLTVFDVLGKEVTNLVNTMQDAGQHSAQWNASRVASGTYFCRMEAGSFVQTNKMVVLK